MRVDGFLVCLFFIFLCCCLDVLWWVMDVYVCGVEIYIL